MNIQQRTFSPAETRYQWRRYMVLGSVIATLALNYYAQANRMFGYTIGEISAKYHTLLTPAGYAFSIWGIIFTGILSFSIYQFNKKPLQHPIVDVIAWQLIYSSIFNCGFVFAFQGDVLWLSNICTLGLLLTLILAFKAAHKTVHHSGAFTLFAYLVISLYTAWASVAVTINSAQSLKYYFGLSGAPLETILSIAALVLVTTVGIVIGYKFKNIAFALVYAWALWAINIKQEGVEYMSLSLSTIAKIGAVLVPLSAFLGRWKGK